LHTIDFLIILAFIIYSLSSGLRARKQASKNLEEYFLAGRSVEGWKAGISMAATQFAADTPLLVMGLIATAGIFSLWQLWIYGISFLLIGFLMAPRWRNARVLTDAELSELRYSGKPALFLRGFKAFYFGTVFNCAVMAMVLLAATRIAEPFLFWGEWLPPSVFNSISQFVDFLGLNLTLETQGAAIALKNSTSNFISIGLIVAVTAMYSMTGGLRSVIDTDVVQFVIMIVSTAIYAWFAVSQAGGLDQIQNQIANLSAQGNLLLTPTQVTAFTPFRAFGVSFPLLAAFALQWLIQMNSDGTGYLAQRIMACKSDKDAKIATVVFTFSQILLRSLLWIPLGLALIVLFPPAAGMSEDLYKANRELTYIRGMVEYLPAGILGILLTGMLAALASTVDTHLNWGASYWTNDIYKRIICESILKVKPDPRSLVWVARLSNILVLIISIYVMTHLVSIQRAWQVSLMLGAGMGIPLLLRWLWWRMNSWAEIAAIAASLIGAPFALF
jgi:solute:Na+ symporter, SSS family